MIINKHPIIVCFLTVQVVLLLLMCYSIEDVCRLGDEQQLIINELQHENEKQQSIINELQHKLDAQQQTIEGQQYGGQRNKVDLLYLELTNLPEWKYLSKYEKEENTVEELTKEYYGNFDLFVCCCKEWNNKDGRLGFATFWNNTDCYNLDPVLQENVLWMCVLL